MRHPWRVLLTIGLLMMAVNVKAEETQPSPVQPEDEPVIENLDILEILDILEEDDQDMLDNLDALQNMNSQEES